MLGDITLSTGLAWNGFVEVVDSLGVPVDLTGRTIQFVIYQNTIPEQTNLLVLDNGTAGGVVVEGSGDSTILISLGSNQTTFPGYCRYELTIDSSLVESGHLYCTASPEYTSDSSTLTIVQGKTGPQGLTGPTGATGPTGVVTASGTAPLTITYNASNQSISGSIAGASNTSAGTMSAANFIKLATYPATYAVPGIAAVLASNSSAGGESVIDLARLELSSGGQVQDYYGGIQLQTIANDGLSLSGGVLLITTNQYGDGLFSLNDNGQVSFGDLNQDNNGTLATLDDGAGNISINTPRGEINLQVAGQLFLATQSYSDGLLAISNDGFVGLGDFNGDYNSTFITIDDDIGSITINATNSGLGSVNAVTSKFSINDGYNYPDGLFNVESGVVNLGDYSDDGNRTNLTIDDSDSQALTAYSNNGFTSVTYGSGSPLAAVCYTDCDGVQVAIQNGASIWTLKSSPSYDSIPWNLSFISNQNSQQYGYALRLGADGQIYLYGTGATHFPSGGIVQDNGSNSIKVIGSLVVNGNIGLFNQSPAAKQTVSGSRASGAALTSLLSALSAYGLITNSSTT
jgi:hypothetical protein